MVEFVIVILLIVFIACGTLVISSAIHYNLKIVQVARMVSKLTFRRCENELRNDPDNSGGTLQPCIVKAAEEALVVSESVLPEVKIWLSVFASSHKPPGTATPSTVIISARTSQNTVGAVVQPADTNFPTALEGLTNFQALLNQAAVATVVEVIAPDFTNSLPFKDWIMPEGKFRRENVVF